MNDEKMLKIAGVLTEAADLEEASPASYKPGGKAHRGMTRAEAIQKTKDDLKRAKELEKDGKKSEAEKLRQRAYDRRNKMEKVARDRQNEALLREFVREILAEKKKKKTKASEANKTALKKKAEKSGYTYGSLKTEFEKGLGAFYSSGSRPGQTPQSWAFARVNKCISSNPSWCSIEKSKAKKKKK